VLVNERATNATNMGIAIDGNFYFPILVALLRGGNKVLAAILNPFYRAPQQYGRQRHRCILGIKNKFWTEPTADVGRDNPDLILLTAQNLTKQLPCSMRRLG